MSKVGQKERATQDRVVNFFQKALGYRYLGNWNDREANRNIEPELLAAWLKKQGVRDALVKRTLRKLESEAALGEGKKLFDANAQWQPLQIKQHQDKMIAAFQEYLDVVEQFSISHCLAKLSKFGDDHAG